MDLGIAGKWAIVGGSSRGLGRACAEALARVGVHVTINGRNAEDVSSTAAALREKFGVEVREVVADLATPAGRDALLAACPDPDILVNNSGGPPPSVFVANTPEMWQSALENNFLSAVDLMQRVIPGMRERGFGRIVNITSAMVTSPHPFMTLSIGARTALTGVAKAVSKEVVADNVTINNLLPERINTGRQQQMAELTAAGKGISLSEAYEEISASIAAKRLGNPSEVGDACAFLCAANSGFISGQNLHLDGGSYDGLI